MPYVAPTVRVTGDLITAAIWNTDLVGNIVAQHAGAMSIAAQAIGDILYATSTTQLGRIPPGAAGTMLRSTGTGAAAAFSTDGGALTNLTASNLATGIVPPARLGSGTPSSTTVLLGDNTWGNLGMRSIQQGTTNIASAATSNTTTISAVTMGKAWIVRRDSISETADGRYTYVTLTSSTVVTATKSATGWTANVFWTVVESYVVFLACCLTSWFA